MRRAAFATLLLLAGTASAEVVIRVTEGRVDVQATAAPLSEVLDRLGRQTGMKVVYEGPAPRPLVSLALERATQVEAVLGILEGLGLNYVLQLDPGGTRVRTLVMAGAATPAASLRPATPSPGARLVPPPISAPDAADDDMSEAEEPDEDEGPPPAPPQLMPPVAPAGTPPPAPTPAPGPAPGVPGGVPGIFGPGYPTQPFTPGPTYSPFGTRPSTIPSPPAAVPAPSPSPAS